MSRGVEAPPLAAVVGYTVRACLPSRRVLLLLPMAGAVLFGLLSLTSDDADAFALVAGTALHTLVLPITCLVIGDAVLGAEIRAGTFAFTWLSPVPHAVIVVGRWLGGWAISLMVLVPAAVLAAVVAGSPEDAGPAAVAVASGSAAYVALFVAIGATFQRPVVWSLALVVIVERLLGAALASLAQLSPSWLAQAVLAGLAGADEDLRRDGVPHGWAAVGCLALVTAAGLWLATRRLRRLRTSSASD